MEQLSPLNLHPLQKNGILRIRICNDLTRSKKEKNVKQKLDNFIKISNEKASQFDLENLIIMVDEEGDLSIKSKSKKKTYIKSFQMD